MAITFTLTQAHVTADGNPSVPTLGSTPTSGNLLILIAAERSGTSHSAYTFTDIGNWTKIIGHDNDLGNANTRCNLAVWIKKAGASESTSHSVDNGTANSIRTVLLELTPSEAVTAYVVPSGGSISTGTGTNVAVEPPISTGSTSSVAAANYLVLTTAGLREGQIIHTLVWDNSPDVQDDEGAGSGNGRVIGYGFKDDATGGVYSSNLTWNHDLGTDTEGIAAIAAIEAQTGGGGGGGPVIFNLKPKKYNSLRPRAFAPGIAR